MKSCKFILFFLICAFSGIIANAQGVKSAKLKNGLSVFIWEDSTMTQTFGMIATKAGSVDDPEEYTGLAHYLEHVMFKGTDRISTLDWAKEKPLYEQIIAKYDEMAIATDPVKKKEINSEINKLTIEASKYSKSNEFSSLVESFGGTGLNAATSFDYTVYFNSFPTSELEKWMELYSSRLVNPVFRAFQAELETVYEEYNRSANDPSRQESAFLLGNIFAGTPYAREILGKSEHLKNPRLSKVHEFYGNWYVPENMALILVGNVKITEILPLVNRKFGRLEAKSSGKRISFTDTEFKGKRKVSGKVGQYPSVSLAFKGVPINHRDKIALEICLGLLYNSTGSGAFNKLVTDGDLLSAVAANINFAHTGRIIIQAIPSYDAAQRRFISSSSVEKMLLSEIDKLKRGDIDEQRVNSIKTEFCKNFDLSMEDESERAELIAEIFISGADMNEALDYISRVQAITLDDIKRIAKEYFNDNYMLLNIEQGKGKREEKFAKPAIDPITSPEGKSQYSEWFETIPAKPAKIEYTDFNALQSKQVNDLSKLYYTKNTENNVFSLTLKYGVGTIDMPRLKLAVPLMNNAGIMAQLKPHEFKEELGKYNASASYSVSDNYLYIRLTGVDEYLREACNLLTRQILMPALDEKQFNNLIGGTMQRRMIEKKNAGTISSAMLEYALYKDKSDYIDRLPVSEINNISISNLTGEFQRATSYAAEIFYAGNLQFDDAYEILSSNLPLKAGESASSSPKEKTRVKPSGNTVYFIPNSDAEQSNIYILIESEKYAIDNDVEINAFNQYFSGGFGSVVLNEIREKKSLAYSTYGILRKPANPGENLYFEGSIGTQGDKTVEAVEMFMNLLKDFPEYKGRTDIVKTYLTENYNTQKPSFRNEARTIVESKRIGYKDDPAKINVPKIQNLTFADIKASYSKYVANKPVVIAITGNPKDIDLNALAKFGKVEKISLDKLFSKE